MVIDTVTNESILDQYGGVRINSLDHILSLDNDDESKLSKRQITTARKAWPIYSPPT